jgi:DNA-directed RNA polymerase sigma subunit (sigma70/sigma32)
VGEGTATYLDLLREPSPGPEADVGNNEIRDRVREAIRGAMGGLDARERLILEKRLLVAGEDAETLADLGRQLGVTRERVRQIQVGLFAKLRAAFLPLCAA